MRRKKVVILAALFSVICFFTLGIYNISPLVRAETDQVLTTLEKAQVLNKLTILRGDNGDFKLDDKLLRSEAAAFIVRIMAKEGHVENNKENYWVTRFPDVISTKWHAPYIGYCSRNGIIEGDEKGNFNPDEPISEKAFLKIVLGSLGYEYGLDFTWDDVYRKAYEAGLVEDSTYLIKTADNLNYSRGQVVDVIYKALTIETKTKKETLVEGLINEKVVSREIVDSIPIGNSIPKEGNIEEASTIEQIFVVDQNRLFIRLSKDIKSVTKEQIKIYTTKDFTNKLEVEVESQNEKTLVLKTSNQEALESYTIEIKNAIYKENNELVNLVGVFTGHAVTELKSDFFRISKVQPISKNMVQVYFTQPININSEDSSFYEIMIGDEVFAQGKLQGITARVPSSDGYCVSLYINGREFSEDTSYTLNISGDLTSMFGCNLNEGLGDSTRFKGVAKGVTIDNEELKVVKISVIDNTTIQLDFNKEINSVLAQQIYNFYITDENDIPIPIRRSKAIKYGSNNNKSIVISTQTPFVKGRNYIIMVNHINDVTRQYSIIENEYSFAANYSEKTNLSITYAQAIDKSSVIVKFNKMLDPATATNPLNYQILVSPDNVYIGNPSKVYYDEVNKPYEVKLFYPEGKTMETGKIYKVKIFGSLQDYLGNSLPTITEYGFAGTNKEPVKPTISDAVIISKDAIKITFNKEIEYGVPNIEPGNYILQYVSGTTTLKKVPISIIYINPTTMVLKFDSLNFETEYKIRALELMDYSGIVTNLKSDDSYLINVRMGQ
jgi:hypothetical protein